jgi:hypothetical protein
MTTVDPPLGTPIAADTESMPTSPEAQDPASAPVVITEQQLLFSSSAAIALPTPRRWNPVHTLGASVRAIFARSDKPPARRHYPRRPAFIEDAAMAREMRRL